MVKKYIVNILVNILPYVFVFLFSIGIEFFESLSARSFNASYMLLFPLFGYFIYVALQITLNIKVQTWKSAVIAFIIFILIAIPVSVFCAFIDMGAIGVIMGIYLATILVKRFRTD